MHPRRREANPVICHQKCEDCGEDFSQKGYERKCIECGSQNLKEIDVEPL